MYKKRGFNIVTMLMDREFEYLKDNIDMAINTTAADEHVTVIERSNDVFNGGQVHLGPSSPTILIP